MSLAPEQLVKSETETQKFPKFRVVMLNDDYTPMDFVSGVLEAVFAMDPSMAHKVTMAIHQQGKGVCGVFTHEIAEAKVAKVDAIAERFGHPLLCEIEPETDE